MSKLPPVVSQLHRFPVKSMMGHTTDTMLVEPWGPAGDRRFMVIDPDGRCRTAREVPAMLLVEPVPRANGLRLRASEHPDLDVDLPTGAVESVQVHRWSVPVVSAGPEAEAWLGSVLGLPSRLMFQADPHGRRVDPKFGAPEDRVSLADGYPLLLTSEASLDALNDWIVLGEHAAEAPVDMTRFRPNIVVGGSDAWAEDGWRRLRIGAMTFRVLQGCARCVLTPLTVTPAGPDRPAGVERGREPLATLVRRRRWDGQSWFGVNLVPDLPIAGVTDGLAVRVGDQVEILDEVMDVDGPLR